MKTTIDCAVLEMALAALKKCDFALSEELAALDIDPPLHHVLEASNSCGPSIAALQAALVQQPAQPQQEPVFWYRPRSDGRYEGPIHNAMIEKVRRESGVWMPLYTSPPAQQSPWCMKMNGCKTKCEDCPDEAPKQRKPLTDEEKLKIAKDVGVKVRTGAAAIKFANAIEAAHNIKENT